MNLNEIEWRCFDFVDIFDINKGFYNKKPLCDDSEMIPFLGATAQNNGVTGWCSMETIEQTTRTGDNRNEPMSRKVFAGGCIAVTNNGSVGHAYYWEHPFTCSHDINPLFLKGRELTMPLAMFLIASIEKQAVCFEYSRKWRPERMCKSRLILPVDENGNPDYQFMEDYIKELFHIKMQQYKQHIKQKLFVLETSTESAIEEPAEWKDFCVSDIFHRMQRGKRFKNDDHVSGTVPYVSSSANNNGVADFVEASRGTRVFKNCISLANSGSVGTAFYEPFAFVASDHVTALECQFANEYIYLFLATVIQKQSSNFSFNREIKDSRLKRMRIMLPVTINGEPDYTYMEQYGKKLMLKKYQQYLRYLEGKSETL